MLDFSKFENATSTTDDQIERKLTPQQQIFIRCLSKLAARDSAFTFRLDSTDGQSLVSAIKTHFQSDQFLMIRYGVMRVRLTPVSSRFGCVFCLLINCSIEVSSRFKCLF